MTAVPQPALEENQGGGIFHYGVARLVSLLYDKAAARTRKPRSKSQKAAREERLDNCMFWCALAMCLLMSLASGTSRAEAQQEPLYNIDIPSLNAADALNRLAEQTGAIMLFPYDLAEGRQANAVVGRYTLLEALDLLLKGTGLSGGLSDKSVISISPLENAETTVEELATMEEKPSFAKKIVAFALSAFAVSGASAQDDNQATADDKQLLEEVVVTGSRIRRAEFDTTVPAVVLNAKYIEDRAIVNIADAINSTPAFGLAEQSGLSHQNTAKVGQSFANLFGLGSQRTLTLVNGRRFVAGNSAALGITPGGLGSAPGQQVDLNLMPVGLIERVEVIAVAGAPIYGADAIAGTMNIILRDDFEGAQFDSSYGISDAGDSEDVMLRALAGGNIAEERGNIVVSLEYTERRGLRAMDREALSNRRTYVNNPVNTGPDDGIPDQIMIDNVRTTLATFGGLPSLSVGNVQLGEPIVDTSGRALQFDSSGNLAPFDLGEVFTIVNSRGGDGLNLSEVENLRTPTRRYLINGLSHYDVTDAVTAYLETSYARTEANDHSSQALWQIALFGGADGALLFPLSNPFLSPQAKEIIEENCANSGLMPGECTFYVSRLSRDVALGRGEMKSDLYRIVTGLKGAFRLGNRSFDWDVSYNDGRTDQFNTRDNVSDRRHGLALDAVSLDAATIAGLDAEQPYNIVRSGSVHFEIPGNQLEVGDIICRAQIDPDVRGDPIGAEFGVPEQSFQIDVNACVPLNLFGEGVLSPEAHDYVNMPFNSNAELRQRVFQATLGGSIAEVPGGPIEFAAGLEYRREEADFSPDAASQLGMGRDIPVQAIGGGYESKEVYAEISVPIISDSVENILFRDVSLQGAARHVDNSLAGTDVTWTAGLRATPSPFDGGISFRGNYTNSIRAPAVTELFLPRSTVSVTAADPCDASNINSGPNPSVREANCMAEAVELGLDPSSIFPFTSNVINAAVLGTSSGNPNLKNEVAESWTAGVVLKPEAISGLSIAVDWVDISISDAISNLGGSGVMAACYDDSNPNEFCDLFVRNAVPGDPFQFQVTSMQTGYGNAGTRDFSGLMLNSEYTFDLGNRGLVTLSGDYFYLSEDESSITGFDVADLRGVIGRPKHKGQLRVNLERDKLGLLGLLHYTGPAVVNNNDSKEARDVFGVGSYWLADFALRYKAFESLDLQLNVDNVFDNQVPDAAAASGRAYVYNFLGRYFRAGFSYKF